MTEAPKPSFEQLHDMLHTDTTGLVAGLEQVQRTVAGFRWATESRGSYEWDDDRFHGEMKNMLDAVHKDAQAALDRWRLWKRPCCAMKDETQRLREDIARYENGRIVLGVELKAAKAEVERLRGDAARWRYLCSLTSEEWAALADVPDDEIDAAIDRRIAQRQLDDDADAAQRAIDRAREP